MEEEYEVVDQETGEVEEVVGLKFDDEEVTATLENGEEVIFENEGEQGDLENDEFVIRETHTHNHPDGSPVKKYMGKEVLAEGEREVNGKKYIHIRLIDGSTHDLTEEDYKLQVIE